MPDRTRKLAAILFTDIVNYTSMMGEDEQRAIEVLKRSRRLQKALVEQFHGEWVQEVGDGTLCTFGSAVDAVNCALELQRVLGDDADLKLRIGIHEGDVVVEGQDVYGDGVNVASRIHALASEGGICVSEKVYDEIRNKPGIEATSLGEKELKNVDRPVKVYELRAPGLLASEIRTHSASWFHSARDSMKNHSAASSVLIALAIAIVGYTLYSTNRAAIQTAFILNVPSLITRATFDQEIGFTTAKDGVRIAYATSGEGPPVVQVLGWFTHLEKGLSSPAFSMAPRWEKQFFFVRFDGRGTGLSDRGIEDYSLDARLSDLEAVVDELELERFSILAHSAGGPLAIAYAVRYPERVNRMVFYGSFARIWATPEGRELSMSLVPVIRSGWGADTPAYRQLFTSLFMPEGDEVDFRIFNEWQRVAATPEDAANFMEALVKLDVRDLAPQVRTPTLVIHRRGDQIVPYDLGRELASLMPGARLLTLKGNNHAFLRGEPEGFEMLEAAEKFLTEDTEGAESATVNR